MACSQNWNMSQIQWFGNIISHVFPSFPMFFHLSPISNKVNPPPIFSMGLVTAQHLKLMGVLAAFGVTPRSKVHRREPFGAAQDFNRGNMMENDDQAFYILFFWGGHTIFRHSDIAI